MGEDGRSAEIDSDFGALPAYNETTVERSAGFEAAGELSDWVSPGVS